MKTFILPRTGLSAATFKGELLANVDGKNLPGSHKRSRWHEIAVYRAESGRFLVHVAFRVSNQHDSPNDQVRIFDEPTDAISFLWNFDCTAAVRGWQGEKYERQDATLRTHLANNFDQLVSELSTMIPEFSLMVA